MNNKEARILIVEDEFLVRMNLEQKLVEIGYTVSGAVGSGEEAISKIRQGSCDIVLMDIMLSGDLDGIQTANIIREAHDVPVIFLTAYSSEQIQHRAAFAEPYAYILKPFDQRELETNIAIALYKHRIEKEIAEKQNELERLNKNLDRIVEDRTSKLIVEISERKKAQAEQQLFVNIIEQTKDQVILTNDSGQILYVNNALCSITEYDRNELIGEYPGKLISNVYEYDAFNDLWERIKSGETISEDIILMSKSNKNFRVGLSVFPLKGMEDSDTKFAWISRDYTEKNRYEKLLTDLLENERQRISKELHDGIGQSVAALKMMISSFKNVQAEQKDKVTQQLNKMVEEITEDIRETSYNLMPSVLRDYGLIAAVKKTIAIIEKNSLIDIRFNYEEKQEKKLEEDVALTLFRIIQEGLSNAMKYANAKKISIFLSCKENVIKLKIQDDGQGFDMANIKHLTSGQGLENMKHRALNHNGYFTIDSDMGKGTTLKIRIPIYEQDTCNVG